MSVEVFRVGHLPGLDACSLAWRELPAPQLPPGHAFEVPALDQQQLQALCEQISGPARQALRALPVREIVQAIDRVIGQLLDPASPEHQLLLRWLPPSTGFSPEMIRVNLSATLRGFRALQLQRFLVEDLGNPALLDGFEPRVTGGWTRAEGSDLLAHVWAGNVPGLPLWSLICGLLAKAGNIGKVSAGEPVFATVFAQTLARIEPRLGQAVAVLWWERQDSLTPQAIWRQADTVLAYGGDAALRDLQAQIPPGVRFLPHGHKLSFGVVGRAALSATRAPLLARLAADDVVRHEQQGCYSPQVFYVERGGQVTPLEFAQRLAAGLQQLSPKFPRPRPGLAESAQIAQWRSALEWSSLEDASVQLLGHPEHDWCVVYRDRATPISPGPLHRCVQVVALSSLDDLPACLAPRRRHLQSAGLAVEPEQLQPLASLLAAVGVTRLSAIGQMAQPAPGWHNDGRPSLLELVTLVDLEASAEALAERLTSYEV
jgi:Acyl-CoA reductase (LuxC)